MTTAKTHLMKFLFRVDNEIDFQGYKNESENFIKGYRKRSLVTFAVYRPQL